MKRMRGSLTGHASWVRSRARRCGALAAVLFVVVAVPLTIPNQLEGQDPTRAPAGDPLMEVRLHDGTTVHGRIVSESADSVTIETPGGTRITVDRARIRSIEVARGRIVDGNFLIDDPNRTRLLFAPSARPLERGEAYIANYMLFFPFVGYGATDRLTLAGGTAIIPDMIGELFYIAPKLTIADRSRGSFAVGTLAFFTTRDSSDGSVGVLYGVGTFEDSHRALSVGMGWGFSGGGSDPRISNDPVIMAGGELRMSRNTKLLTENWFAFGGSGTSAITTGGVRFFGERLSADLGIGAFIDRNDAWCCIPVVNFVYNVPRGR